MKLYKAIFGQTLGMIRFAMNPTSKVRGAWRLSVPVCLLLGSSTVVGQRADMTPASKLSTVLADLAAAVNSTTPRRDQRSARRPVG